MYLHPAPTSLKTTPDKKSIRPEIKTGCINICNIKEQQLQKENEQNLPLNI